MFLTGRRRWLNVASGVVTLTLTYPADSATGVTEPITFTWNAYTGATDYQIQIASENTFASPVINTTTSNATSYETSALDAGSTYYWRVRARL